MKRLLVLVLFMSGCVTGLTLKSGVGNEFRGNVGGRELAMSAMGCRNMKKAKKMVFRDVTYAVIGLVISFFIALGVNDHFKAVFLR